ncbi:MAG: tRNA (adenosine(37)-N6)-threonylcarbamoyltransferase complex ATPase subunit type 1 TsaE [Clostridia bacterium]|nr:tRNA (adenosine(37)-N6)-threonylcarbamoyltransferase complex ATPase subunit type 1 TsaE [Clostridia bacterium]
MYSIITHSFEETERFGERLASALLGKRFFIALFGDIGAGKTVFVRGMTKILSPGSRVKSPTYTIVNEYRRGEIPIFHFDLYRVEDPDDLDGFGFEEYVSTGSCITEWSENIADRIPDDAIIVRIEKLGESDRRITVERADELLK